MSTDVTGRFPRLMGWIGGLFFLLLGLFAMAAPRAFFDTVATFEPYNQHFLQDLGAFQVGLGAVLLLALLPGWRDALAVVLVGVGIGSAAHVVAHVVGVGLGGTPALDIPSLSVLAVALLAAGVARRRDVARSRP